MLSHTKHGRPNFFRIVLDPAVSRIVLGELLLGNVHCLAFGIKDNRAGTRCPLVNRKNRGGHSGKRKSAVAVCRPILSDPVPDAPPWDDYFKTLLLVTAKMSLHPQLIR